MTFINWIDTMKYGFGFIGKWFAKESTINGETVISFVGNEAFFIGAFILTIALGYFVGSLNFGIILSRIIHKDDVRNHGSGNAGATNMLRTYGKGTAALTLLLDILKAAIVTFVSMLIGGEIFGYVAGFSCMLGHAFPIYFKFKGGKGVACAAAIMLVLEPIPALICLLVFVLTVAWTRYVSLGSIFAASLVPVFVNSMYGPLHFPNGINGREVFPHPIIAITTVLIAVFIVYLHRKNIKRIMNKTESKISFGKKKEENEKED